MRHLVAAIGSSSVAALRRALRRDAALARKPRLVLKAAQVANLEALELLLGHGADPNASWRGYRPLHAVIQQAPHAAPVEPGAERLACLELLLERGADPELTGAFPPARPLLIAAFCAAPPFIERLRAAGAHRDGFVASALGDQRTVTRLLRTDPGFAQARDAGGMTALQCAAASRLGECGERVRRALLGIARRLLDAGADPNAQTRAWSDDVDVTYFAASAGNLELFRLLLERGADATAALPSALWNTGLEFAELALAHGAVPDRAHTEDRPLLNDLVRCGQVRQVLWLVEHGARPNLPDERGWTALHQAASRGNARMLAALLAVGGDRKRRDRAGHTPLDIARQLRRPKMVELLQEKS